MLHPNNRQMKVISILFAILVGMVLGGQAQVRGSQGKLSTRSYEVADFQALQIGGAFQVELTQKSGNRPTVQIETDTDLHEHLEVEVIEGVLHVDTKGDFRNPTRLMLYVSNDQFREIQLSGANTLSSTTPLYGEALRLKLSGASEVDLAVDHDELEVYISGAGSVMLQGKSDKVAYVVSGVGSISAYALQANLVEVEVSGTGSAKVHATEALLAQVSGMGSVRYIGDPAVQKQI
jgi:hypothetical protein